MAKSEGAPMRNMINPGETWVGSPEG